VLGPFATDGVWNNAVTGEFDGFFALILESGHVVWTEDYNMPPRMIQQADWPGNAPFVPFDGNLPYALSTPSQSNGLYALLQGCVLDVVTNPRAWFSDLPDVMLGVCGGFPVSSDGAILGPPLVFGLFGSGDYTNLRLIPIGSMYGSAPYPAITAVFSSDAQTVSVGTSDGSILRLQGGGKVFDALPQPQSESVGVPKDPNHVVVVRFAATADGSLFAGYGMGEGGANYLLRRGGDGLWNAVDNGMFMGFGAEHVNADETASARIL
jgi:hypothetical protein